MPSEDPPMRVFLILVIKHPGLLWILVDLLWYYNINKFYSNVIVYECL